MMLTSPKHGWRPRKPSGRAGNPWRCQRFATATALSAASRCRKSAKSTVSTTALNAPKRQNAVCGGGRYDNLSESIGGPHLTGVGFAAGIDRIILVMEQQGASFGKKPQNEVYVVAQDDAARGAAHESGDIDEGELRRDDLFRAGDLG